MSDTTTPTTKLLDVVVRRPEWGRGNHQIAGSAPTVSRLYNSISKKYCCLGFMCEALSMPLSELDNVAYPFELWPRYSEKPFPEALNPLVMHYKNHAVGQSALSVALTRINDVPLGQACMLGDDPLTVINSEEEREQLLKEYGVQAGINFTFVD